MLDHEEDWPVLHPRRPTSPGTLQEMMRQTGSQLAQQNVSGEKERYPVLGNTVRQVPSEDQLPISRYSSVYKIPRKEVSSPNLGKKQNANKENVGRSVAVENPFKDANSFSEPVMPIKAKLTSPSDLSTSAAAIEKLAQESKPTIEPRQTRTSSLRARLSAGQLVKDGQTKVVGFTDFTAPDEPATGPSRRDSFRERKEAHARRSITPPVAQVVRSKPSKDSISSNRAPAQFIAGSRRPVPPRRPGSRGSIRSEPRASSPPLPGLPPSRIAPLRPASRDGNGTAKSFHKSQAELRASPGKSSIPVFRRTVSNVLTQAGDRLETSEHKNIDQSKDTKTPRDEFNIFENHSSAEFVQELEDQATPAKGTVDKDARVLEAIEESPQHAYQLKHLSMNSPEFGPTLRISPSAERFIMGPNTPPVNQFPKKSKELGFAIKKNETQERKSSAKSVSAEKERPERPLSSQGLSNSGSLMAFIDRKARDKKAKSADLSLPSPTGHLGQDILKSPPYLNHENTDASAKASQPSTSTSFNDPFFDAPEAPSKSIRHGSAPNGTNDRSGTIAEDAWISPLKENPDNSIEGITQANTEYLPLTHQGHIAKEAKEKINKPIGANPFEDSNVVAQDFAIQAKQANNNKAIAIVAPLPSTPQQAHGKENTNSGSHPPRSSSRMAHPDYTTTKLSPISPLSPEKGPPTPPKDHVLRQNNLGSIRGHASTQLDLKDPTSNRDSTSRQSSKSQASASKGMLSNIRGLFHKRSSENAEPLKSSKKTTKPKVASNGSPFPPISEIHPIHRPTLSSTNRSTAPTPRPSTSLSAAAPATPSYASPAPTEVSATTTLAMQILNSARNERSSPKKERLLELGKIMVDGITQARDAEKAMEEAKQSARKAEVAFVLCKKSLREVTRCVEEWKREVGR